MARYAGSFSGTRAARAWQKLFRGGPVSGGAGRLLGEKQRRCERTRQDGRGRSRHDGGGGCRRDKGRCPGRHLAVRGDPAGFAVDLATRKGLVLAASVSNCCSPQTCIYVRVFQCRRGLLPSFVLHLRPPAASSILTWRFASCVHLVVVLVLHCVLRPASSSSSCIVFFVLARPPRPRPPSFVLVLVLLVLLLVLLVLLLVLLVLLRPSFVLRPPSSVLRPPPSSSVLRPPRPPRPPPRPPPPRPPPRPGRRSS